MASKNAKALRAVLDASNSTADFLQDVISAIETLYSETDDFECPAGFAALDEAVQAFGLAEGE